MKNIIYLVSLILGSLLFGQCKGCKDTETNSCGGGYEPQGNECKCPDGKFEAFGVCRALEENEYYGILDCLCSDSIFFKVTFIREKDNGEKEAWVQTITEYGSPTNRTLDYVKENGVEKYSGSWSGSCKFNGKLYGKQVEVKSVGTDSLHFKMYYTEFDPNIEKYVIRDSCSTYLHK